MSSLEKVIGIIVIIVVFIVILFIFYIGTLWLVNFRNTVAQKKKNPTKKFPRNSKGNHLTKEEQKALNVGAILAEMNHDYCDSLQTSKLGANKFIKNLLFEYWEITSTEEAIEVLDNLKYKGHRNLFSFVLNTNLETFNKERTFKEFKNHFNQSIQLFLSQKTIEEYPKEIELAEKHLDIFVNAYRSEDIEPHRHLFGEKETLIQCIQIYHEVVEGYFGYIQYVENLKSALSDLEKKKRVDNQLQINTLNLTAWDMGRIVNVARYCYDCGYITEQKAWEYIFFAEKESSFCYQNWEEFAQAYIVGRAIWGGSNLQLSSTIDVVERLLKDENSPWILYKKIL